MFLRYSNRKIFHYLVLSQQLKLNRVRIQVYYTMLKIMVVKYYVMVILLWTIFIYNSWYPILIFTVALLAIFDNPVYHHFMLAYVIGCLACYIIFIFFQNEVPRSGELKGDGLAQSLLRLTRKVNRPYNGFPSIHIFACTMTILAVQTSTLPLGFKLFIWVSQLGIAISTLTTRQHVLLDVAGGIFMASLAWILTL